MRLFFLSFPCLDNLIRVFMIEKETKIKTRCEIILRFSPMECEIPCENVLRFFRSIKMV